MEHRMKYRDIPWGVALTVLPGKIIGHCIIRPANRTIRNWKRILIKIGKVLAATLLGLIILFFALLLIESTTDGVFSNFFLDTFKELLQ